MKITPKIHTPSLREKRHTNINFKSHYHKNINKLVLDKVSFAKPQGLSSIDNVKCGKFGTICDGSIPLSNFLEHIKQFNLKNITKNGISTNRDGYAPSFLKTSANNPISTSYVHDCSVMYLFNENTNTHTLYHSLWNIPKNNFKFIAKNFMPEGVTHAALAPGNKIWTSRHYWTLPTMFDAIKENNPNTIINVYHNNSLYPEIVGYKGSLFEIPNRDVLAQLRKTDNPKDFGQASFQISDIKDCDTLDIIDRDKITIQELKQLKEDFNQRDYDIEVKKVLNSIIEQYITVLGEIKSLNLKTEITKFKPSQILELLKNLYQIIQDEVTKYYKP